MTDPVTRLNAALEGHYAIEREIGEGGMATVYLANDLRHERKVALKVLKPELAAVVGGDRFLAEIKTTANLQHPNILPLFDSGQADSFLYYVMPYVEGETLRGRLDRERQLPVDEAVRIATDLAEALDYAHRHKVIHRDIKPANILLQEGRPLIADFGIALAVGAAGGARLTETGLSVGTPFYMSPEQATGDSIVASQSDTYALGCVLFEMLTGDPPYPGSTAQAVLGKIIAGKPVSATAIRPTIPSNVDAAIRCALEKLAADRFTSAQAFATALSDPGFRHGGGEAGVGDPRGAGVWRPLAIGSAAVAVAATALAAWAFLGPAASPGVLRYELTVPLERGSVNDFGSNLALSPDGSTLAYVGAEEGVAGLWVRERQNLEPRALSGGENAHQPFFSPDGQRIAFITGSRALRVVSLSGEPPVTLADSGIVRGGGSWGRDGYIYLSGGDGNTGTPDRIIRMPDTGGPTEPVSTLDSVRGEIAHIFPEALPGGRGVLFSAVRERLYQPDLIDIAVLDLETGEHKVLLEGLMAHWSVTGHILVVRSDGALLAAPFDEKKLELTGPAVPLLGGVGVESFATADVAVSETGTLVYAPGEVTEGGGSNVIVRVTREGDAEEIDPGWSGLFFGPRLSPDGGRLAVRINGGGERHIWIKQLDQGPLAKLTFGPSRNSLPSWTPDGAQVAFSTDRQSDLDLFLRRADGGVAAAPLLEGEGPARDVLFSSDGEWMVYNSDGLWAQRMGGDSEPIQLLELPAFAPALSPDGRWLAYVSEDAGQPQVYVRPFPETDRGKWLVSNTEGGQEPVWAHSGNELFYKGLDRNLVAVEVLEGSTFVLGEQRTLFSTAGYRAGFSHAQYDISPDDQWFVMVSLGLSAEGAPLIVVENFFEELLERVGN
ncbi:MAG: hypothetical protein BMS9Abin29_2501 [Gemmatimonadota bacterium]|nr:MAG: hypothetical protein BMS9Abin29_2501 [Gemmatimonadota bacterium]